MREAAEGLPETDRTVAMGPLLFLRRTWVWSGTAPEGTRQANFTGAAGIWKSWCGTISGTPNSRGVKVRIIQAVRGKQSAPPSGHGAVEVRERVRRIEEGIRPRRDRRRWRRVRGRRGVAA
ncbi:hypothetical protein GCM10010251_74140 [Streptomyces aurantiogriseus]|uniref:Uncharacterized protein n=1 Tax=Streptomyces aurantiogriseus TaxID=66870 RepID=A0A918FKJ4_9ACTN|nr:hypothetical protein GCM10010251_74140 [Streptomyces aurantiogriseus]